MIELTPDTVEVHFGATTLTPTTGEVWFRNVKIWPPPPPVVTPPAQGSKVTSAQIVNAGPVYPFLTPGAWTNAYNFKTQNGVIVKGTVHADASGHIDNVNLYQAFGTVSVGDMLTCDDFGGLSVRITGVA